VIVIKEVVRMVMLQMELVPALEILMKVDVINAKVVLLDLFVLLFVVDVTRLEEHRIVIELVLEIVVVLVILKEQVVILVKLDLREMIVVLIVHLVLVMV
jgi:hypothetical protein